MAPIIVGGDSSHTIDGIGWVATMTTTRWARSRHAALGAALVAALALSGCASSEPSTSADPTTSPGPQGVEPPNQADAASSAALAAYTSYADLADSARAAPDSQGWRPVIEEVAQGQALDAVIADVENYASLPARTVGVVSHSPEVSEVGPRQVSVVDCVDLGDSRLISDTTGEVFDDLENRVQRFRFHAKLGVEPDGRWVVQETEPLLDEPC